MTNTISINRRFQWAMGHTLKDHDGPCKNLHGHNYVGLFDISPGLYYLEVDKSLDEEGMIFDFGKIKELIGSFIDEMLDHRFFVNRQDPRCNSLHELDSTVMIVDFNPTAENLALWLIQMVNGRLREFKIRCTRLVLYETENCYAEVRSA